MMATQRTDIQVDRVGLYWKEMPARTSIVKEEKSMPGLKAAKKIGDSVTRG